MTTFHSTRSTTDSLTSKQAIRKGIADDGGLFVTDSLGETKVDIASLTGKPYQQIAAEVLGALLPDFTEAELAQCIADAYGEQWSDRRITPLKPLGDDYILELFNGPTSAFKDVALQILPRFMAHTTPADGDTDEKIMILTATSGDTGKAAMEGFCDVPGTKIIVFYPHGGVSAVQQAQMATQAGENVCVCAVRGNFDDAQTGVKKIFSAVSKDQLLEGKGVRLSSANSINIGRLAPQVVYYYRAYADLVQAGRIQPGDKVDYVVPTGNFGDILAGYFAKEMGLPVGRLVCASNANNVLTDFLRTGRYDRRRPFYKTVSPSMDILVSSNLERLLYLLSGDDKLIADLMKQLSENGEYEVPADMLEKLHELFWAGFCDDEGAKTAIGKVWKDDHYLCDTHTAVAWDVAQQYKQANPEHNAVVVLSTASPYKFPAAVLEGIGEKAEGDEFDVMEQLHKVTGVPVPKNLADLRSRAVRHRDVIDRGEMLDYVLGKAAAEK